METGVPRDLRRVPIGASFFPGVSHDTDVQWLTYRRILIHVTDINSLASLKRILPLGSALARTVSRDYG
jgi:hypothetical protein